MSVRHKVDAIEFLLDGIEDELLNPKDPFNKVVYLEQVPEDFNKENKQQADKFKRMAGVYVPLHHCDVMLDVRNTLVDEFPYAVEIIDTLLKPSFKRVSVGKQGVVFEPTVIVGQPGLGKTRLLTRLMEELSLQYRSVSVASMQDDHIFGVARGFSTAMPSLASQLIVEHEIGNPVIILDEIDKAYMSRNGSIQNRLLGVLEPVEAMRWHEPFLSVPVNLSYVGWLMTANTIDTITDPLKSRCRILKMPAPELKHLPRIIQEIRKEVAIEDGLDVRFYPDFDLAEREALFESYQKHKSIRVLKRQVKEIISMRKLTLQ